MKSTYPFFRRMMYYSNGNYWCEILDDKAFYFASKARNHIRLIAIAVKQEHQRQKIGEKGVIPFVAARFARWAGHFDAANINARKRAILLA